MRYETQQWPIHKLMTYYPHINLNPPYQRQSVWKTKQKQLLIDSIIRGIDIPKVYFRIPESSSRFRYEVSDGQQRIRAIYEFVRDEFQLSPEYTPEHKNLKFNRLPPEVQMRITEYELTVVVVVDAEEEEIRELFSRFQNGTALNEAEKRHAINSKLNYFIQELTAQHIVFTQFRKSNSRYLHEQLAAQCAQLEISGRITGVQATQLGELYRKNFDPDGVSARKMVKVFDFMGAAFADPTPPEFSEIGMFVSMYWLIHETMEQYALSGLEPKMRDFLVEVAKRRAENSKLPPEQQNHELAQLALTIRYTSDGAKQITKRHNYLWREWLIFASPKPLDKKRHFTEDERLAIYRRDNGICHLCGQPVAWEDFEADHVIPHSKGGTTTLDNGRASHKSCNASKGATE